jgi:hypothetical protein
MSITGAGDGTRVGGGVPGVCAAVPDSVAETSGVGIALSFTGAWLPGGSAVGLSQAARIQRQAVNGMIFTLNQSTTGGRRVPLECDGIGSQDFTLLTELRFMIVSAL